MEITRDVGHIATLMVTLNRSQGIDMFASTSQSRWDAIGIPRADDVIG